MKPARRERPPLIGYLEGRRIAEAARALSAGAVLILPTDTLYGFHCAASCRAAIERIRALKGRRSGVGFILLASDLAMADRLVASWPRGARAALAAAWPAPLTAVLPASSRVPCSAARRGSVAVRIPAHDRLRRLIRALGTPVLSTSVNVSGRPPMTRIADIRRSFPGLAGYLSRRGRPSASPSTVVDFTRGEPSVVRAGKYPWHAARRPRRSPSRGSSSRR
jgi:L-threonylcarbamoyladenylate synthase